MNNETHDGEFHIVKTNSDYAYAISDEPCGDWNEWIELPLPIPELVKFYLDNKDKV